MASTAAVDSVRRLGIDLVEVRPRADRTVDLVAVVPAADRARLAARGWVPADLPRSPAAAALDARRAALGVAAYTVYRDFDDPVRGINAWLRAFAASHGNVTLDSIGASGEGRPILIAKVGPANDDPNRPNVLFMATYHAREWAATEMALRLLEYLADSLPLKTPNGPLLLAERDIWVLPVVNPDGYQYTFAGQRLWRKNRRPNGDGTFGVDLNRNHNGFWGFDNVGSSNVTGSEVYRGPSAASEPETRAVEAFHRAHPPLASVSYHTYTGLVLYPWGHADGARTGDDALFRALAGTDVAPAIRDSIPGSINSYYHPGPGWNLYTTNGEYTGYAYRQFRTAAFTVELTSGCCINSNEYYGFEFPDSEPLLRRMVRDNLPFAIDLIDVSGLLAVSALPPGAGLAEPQLESVWPQLRATLNVPTPPNGSPVDVAIDSGRVGLVVAQRDSLGVGRRFIRMNAESPLLADSRAARLPLDGLRAEILARDGAEGTSAWTGFHREGPAFEGALAWHGVHDTLTSPAIPVVGRSNLVLFFWTRHYGSVFAQQSRGRVQVSTNGGATWTNVSAVVGAGPQWYPIAVPLQAVTAGASAVRVRFIAEDMDWWIDAVSVTASDVPVARLFTSGNQAPGGTIEVSANPVTSAPVTLRWPQGSGSARVDVFSLTGTLVATASLPADPGRWQWDLTTVSGQRVANGAYFLVVTLSDGTRIRRRLLVAR